MCQDPALPEIRTLTRIRLLNSPYPEVSEWRRPTRYPQQMSGVIGDCVHWQPLHKLHGDMEEWGLKKTCTVTAVKRNV